VKKFEFQLHRVLDLRRQQEELERASLLALTNTLNGYELQRTALAEQLAGERTHVRQSAAADGGDYLALAEFERHVKRRSEFIAAQKIKITKEIAVQRTKVIEAQRRVKLLENLREKRLTEWNSENDREIEALGADSHLSRLLAGRRRSAF
jgi:flagellar export protein FliJ